MLDRRDFTIVEKPEGIKIPFLHDIRRCTSADSPLPWIAKAKGDSLIDAHIELLAQEFFRLLIPTQPETRLAFKLMKDDSIHYFIFSQEIPGYTHLPRYKGSLPYTNLGDILVIAMLLQEVDLKNGNIGWDGYVVKKIDGDQCFATLQGYKKPLPISETCLSDLPYPMQYSPYHWLDLVDTGNANYQDSVLLNPQDFLEAIPAHNVPEGPRRPEINRALLKICLLPDSFIKRFVSTYLQDNPGDVITNQQFIDTLTTRRDALKQLALRNESFLNYLNGPEAAVVSASLLEQMRSQKYNNRIPIVKKDSHIQANLEAQACLEIIAALRATNPNQDEEFNRYLRVHSEYVIDQINHPELLVELRMRLQAKLQERDIPALIQANQQLLKTLKAAQLTPEDPILQDYLQENTQYLREHNQDAGLLINLRTNLQTTLDMTQNTNKTAQKCLTLINQIQGLSKHPRISAIVNEHRALVLRHRFDKPKLQGLQAQLAQTLLYENCNWLLQEIADNKFSDNDIALQIEIEQRRVELDAGQTPAQLEKLQSDLQILLRAVSSKEAKAVRGAITALTYALKTQLFKGDRDKKIMRIEQALNELPLLEREFVISSPLNDVQIQLASHRDAIQGDLQIKNGQIVLEKAAHTYQMLKAQFPTPNPKAAVDEAEGPTPSTTLKGSRS